MSAGYEVGFGGFERQFGVLVLDHVGLVVVNVRTGAIVVAEDLQDLDFVEGVLQLGGVAREATVQAGQGYDGSHIGFGERLRKEVGSRLAGAHEFGWGEMKVVKDEDDESRRRRQRGGR